MNPFTDPEVDETAPTVEMPLRPRTGAPAPDQSNTTPTSSNTPQANPAFTMEMPLRPRTNAPAPHQFNTTPTSSNAPQTNPAPTMEMPLRPRPRPSAPAAHQANTTPTSSTAPQNYEARIAQLEKELAESKQREEALRTDNESLQTEKTTTYAFVNDLVDAANKDVVMGDDDYDDRR